MLGFLQAIKMLEQQLKRQYWGEAQGMEQSFLE